MRRLDGSRFQADGPWTGPLLATIGSAAVKLRWADRPFPWHANTTEEVFVVLDGVVDMHVRDGEGPTRVVTLAPGDLLVIAAGESHAAHPRGAARMLVIEAD